MEVQQKNDITKSWKGKRTDVLLAFIYFVIYGIFLNFSLIIYHSIKHGKDIIESLKSPSDYFMMIPFVLFSMFAMSPAWVYFKKVPKELTIDSVNRNVIIKKRKRTLRYDMDRIRFCRRTISFFYILEIHATFESSRNGSFERLATSIIVPTWGLSWNLITMNEIVHTFTNLEIEEITDSPNLPIQEYFYN